MRAQVFNNASFILVTGKKRHWKINLLGDMSVANCHLCARAQKETKKKEMVHGSLNKSSQFQVINTHKKLRAKRIFSEKWPILFESLNSMFCLPFFQDIVLSHTSLVDFLLLSAVWHTSVPYVTLIPVRVSDTIRIGYADTHFPKKHRYRDTARIINNYI